MKPITDDQILSLMKGLEAREKRAMKCLAAATVDPSAHSGQATARVFAFKAGPMAQSMRRLIPADIIPLGAERAAKNDHKTIHGRFISLVPNSPA